MPDAYKAITNIGTREHPQHKEKSDLWDFLLASYKGGLGMSRRFGMSDDWARRMKLSGFYSGVFSFPREDPDSYAVRCAMTPYTPLARQIIDEFAKYVTKDKPVRENAEPFFEFLENVNRAGKTMDEFIARDVLPIQLALGEYNILVDEPVTTREFVSLADARSAGVRPYVTPILPQSIVDWAETPDGSGYEWLIIEENKIINTIEMESAAIIRRRIYWDSEIFQIFEYTPTTKSWEWVYGKSHRIGRVPVVRVVTQDADVNILTPESWAFDLFDLNRALYNMDSLDFANLYMQTLNTLILPNTGDDAEARKLAAAYALGENPAEKGISRYIAPSGTPYEAFDRKIESIIRRMYMVAGLQHRTEKNVAESGISKSWDFERVNQFLASEVKVAEYAEREIIRLVSAWMGRGETDYQAIYPKDFSVKELSDTVESILGLKTFGFYSDTGRKEAAKYMYREILTNLSEETRAKIEKEIDESEETNPFAGFDIGRTEE